MSRVGVNDNRVGPGPGRPLVPALSTVALFGANAIVAQVLLLRECLVVVAGSELFIALFYGCWFLGIATGAATGAFSRVRTDGRLPALTALLLLIQVSLLPLLMISIRAVRARWGLPAWQLAPFWPLLRMALLHLCPFSFLTGLTFPMLCRLAATIAPERGRSIGLIYAIESLGSLLGGIVVTFVFTAYCRPLTGAWAIALATSANLVWFLRAGAPGPWRQVARTLAGALSLVFLATLATPLRTAIEQWAATLRHRAYDPSFEWLEERYTPYQHLALVRLGDQFSLLSNGKFVATFPNPYATSQTVHLMMSQADRTERLLVIGGAESGALRSLLRYPDIKRIDYLEIDPQLLDLVRSYLGEGQRRAFADRRVRIIHEDARRFVRRRSEQLRRTGGPFYDAVLCTVPDPSTAALNRFFTLEFFRQVRGLLNPWGVLVTSISSGVNYFDRELLNYVGSVYQGLFRTFGHVLATPGSRAYLFATAEDDLLTSDVQRLIARFEKRGVEDGTFSPLYFFTAYERAQLNLVNRSLRATLGSVRPNTDLEPVTYLYHLRIWNRLSGARSQRFFTLVERYKWKWIVWACLAVVLLRLATWRWLPLTSDRAAYRHAAGVLFVTGTGGMLSSIVLLLLFQNFHGSLYREVGLLVAFFMLGLTAGGLGANRIGRDRKRSLLWWMTAFAFAYAGFFLLFESLAAGRLGSHLGNLLFERAAFFHLAMAVAGMLTGAQFPLVGRLALVCGRDPGRAGGTLECLDHIGACIGAFVTGIVLIPVSGMAATLRVFALIEIVAAISLALSAISLIRARPR